MYAICKSSFDGGVCVAANKLLCYKYKQHARKILLRLEARYMHDVCANNFKRFFGKACRFTVQKEESNKSTIQHMQSKVVTFVVMVMVVKRDGNDMQLTIKSTVSV